MPQQANQAGLTQNNSYTCSSVTGGTTVNPLAWGKRVHMKGGIMFACVNPTAAALSYFPCDWAAPPSTHTHTHTHTHRSSSSRRRAAPRPHRGLGTRIALCGQKEAAGCSTMLAFGYVRRTQDCRSRGPTWRSSKVFALSSANSCWTMLSCRLLSVCTSRVYL